MHPTTPGNPAILLKSSSDARMSVREGHLIMETDNLAIAAHVWVTASHKTDFETSNLSATDLKRENEHNIMSLSIKVKTEKFGHCPVASSPHFSTAHF